MAVTGRSSIAATDIDHSKAAAANTRQLLRALALALLAAVGGAIVWFGIESFFGRWSWARPYTGMGALVVGGAAGYGALRGDSRTRGRRAQAAAVVATVVVLLFTQGLVTRLTLVRDAAAVYDVHGVGIALPIRVYWNLVTVGLLGTAPPGVVYWGIALGYAIAFPRRLRWE